MNLTRAQNKKVNYAYNTHYDIKRRIIAEKKLGETFECSRTKKCSTTLSLEQSRQCFQKFWELSSYDAQTPYIGSLENQYDKKGRIGQRPKKNSRMY